MHAGCSRPLASPRLCYVAALCYLAGRTKRVKLGTAVAVLPIRNAALFRWCLDRKFKVMMPMTLMSIGLYNEPRGAFLPSIIY